MISAQRGNNISEVEVTHISKHGLWILLGDEELFLSFTDFPWFKTATVANVIHVEWPQTDHLYWPELDVDLSVQSIRDPARFPLVSNSVA